MQFLYNKYLSNKTGRTYLNKELQSNFPQNSNAKIYPHCSIFLNDFNFNFNHYTITNF